MRSLIMTTTCRLSAVLLASLLAGTAHAQSVPTYHGDGSRRGLYVVPALSWTRARAVRLDPGFAPRFSGQLYAQPLYWQPRGATAGLLIVAIENDTVAAIDAVSGRTVWTRSLGRSVPLSNLPCGDIDPVGITGTPVIDAPSQTLYLNAMASPIG